MPQPYGTWSSPFAAADIASSAPRIDGARFVGDEIWWGESVPAESGRVTVRRSSGDTVLPAPWSARSRVHEYGGGAWTADEQGTLFFVEASDQRVYRLQPGSEPEALTAVGADGRGPRHGGLRFQHGRLLAVREDLGADPHRRAIIEVPLDGRAADEADAVRVVVEGSSFFAHPVLSPDGRSVAYVEWSGTRMPWQSAQLHVRTEGAGGAFEEATIDTVSALQPHWISDSELLYLDDRPIADDGPVRWSLHRAVRDASGSWQRAGVIAPADADTGYGLWVLGNRWYQPLPDGRIVAVRTNGADEVVVVDRDGAVQTLEVPASAHVSVDDVSGTRVLLSGGGATVNAGLWVADVESGDVSAVRGGAPADSAWMPPARAFTIDGAHGPVHAFDYPPANPNVVAPDGELPPYIVFVHGGPTAHVAGAASAAIAFYTSRGIGVLDVNYGGSTGYGRAYRERLDGQWGVVDVDDVLAAARGLAESGRADPRRIAIRGGSAGGWTVLSALVRGGVFAAGISRYGVADLRMLAEDAHDFEKHYIDGLVGQLPEAEQVYVERSPLTHTDRIDVPVLLLQGEDDQVVPPSQSEAIRDALAERGVPHEYVLYPGEGHGFRKAETIVDSLERELAFLGRAFGFTSTR
ncbi:dipeptidyl aminopeptidase/acylaminoacyl peptidase [Microbacterium ginsengiterrae]|uniref:Dipeptidyl aminopeptidase/acylaminoacyl peptidase n=1 Tax=Microbacterium ginsengiterrae TaxID=546115 RepID=A0A7W9CA17_9MICO|nr:prolyl oligopeptidase family serine peptidase [Microbacterium ginsengiterrae]MBB5741755.1 dipeptidyl aminopeptidase/acylaminoacyl peptidase [Microbacterium ginsengiterrae]